MTNGSGGAPNKGMLSSESGNRKSFVAHLVNLYQREIAFRGMTDFAVIGAVVLAFVSPPQKVVWPWSEVSSGQAPVAPSSPSAASQTSSSQAATTTGPVVPIPFQDVFKQPKLSLGFLFDIDDAAFNQSLPADREKLKAARLAIARQNSSEAIDLLRSATATDPNVMLLRGAAFILNDNAEGNRTAELLWRQAIAGGSRQASALLGRLLISGREGATNNAAEGLRLIEAGVAAGDPQAMRFAGMGYMSGEFGRFDAFKGAEFFKRAADAGDGMAAGFYARLMADGIGVSAPDAKQAEAYLRRAANAGVTMAQYTLGAWLQYQAAKGLIPDPKEGVEWLTRAYEKGNYIASLPNLSYIYFNGTAAPWNNPTLGAQWIRKCSGYKMADCQTNTAYAYELGLFGSANLPMAYVHREIARQLNSNSAGDYAQKLWARLSASEKEVASRALTATLASLKPQPAVIALQYKDMKPASPAAADIVDATIGRQQANAQPSAQPANADAKANNASELNKQGKFKEAIDEATAALVLSPTNSTAMFARGASYISLRQYDLALADYDALVRQDGKNASYLNQRGLTLFRKGSDFYDRALADYTQGLAFATSDAARSTLYFNRGLIYKLRSQYTQALAELNEAQKLNPKDGNIYIELGRVKIGQGQYNDAEVDLTHAIELMPQSGSGYFYRGLAKPSAIYARQADCSGGSRNPGGIIGGSCSLPLDFDDALNDFKTAISRDPDNTEYHFQVGRLLAAAKNRDGAILAYSNAIKADPSSSNSFLNRANLYNDIGQYKLAMSDYDEAIRLDARNKFAWGSRANLFYRLGDKQRAISEFRAALNIDPNYAYAKDGLMRLGVRP